VNWTEILSKGGVPEPPGYQETVETMAAKPKRQKGKAKKKNA
jgi:hypothetical protein